MVDLFFGGGFLVVGGRRRRMEHGLAGWVGFGEGLGERLGVRVLVHDECFQGVDSVRVMLID